MNRNQFINTICKQDSSTVNLLIDTLEQSLRDKDGSILNAKFNNKLVISIYDYTFKNGQLSLLFKAKNPLPEYNGSVDIVTKYNVPPNLAVELPKLLLDLFSDLSILEFPIYYRKFLIFKRPIICSIKPTDEVKKKANHNNLSFNTGYNANVENTKVDIKKYGVRDNKKIEPLYAEILARLINKEVSESIDNLKISEMNTIVFKCDNKEFHLTHSALLCDFDRNYIIIYDSLDGKESKESSIEYIEKNYKGKEKIVALEMLKTIN